MITKTQKHTKTQKTQKTTTQHKQHQSPNRPEIQAEAALVNFSVTEDGLEDQLLAMVVEQERPDLATQRLDLISQQNGFLIKMQELEDDILYRLSTAEGVFVFVFVFFNLKRETK